MQLVEEHVEELPQLSHSEILSARESFPNVLTEINHLELR
jgi:hypothetical protein